MSNGKFRNDCGDSRFVDASPPTSEARRPTWRQATTAMSSSGMRCIRSRHRAIRRGRFLGRRRQHVFPLQVAEAIRRAAPEAGR